MCYIGVTEGKIEQIEKRRQNEGKYLNLHLHYTLCLPGGANKIS